MFRTYQQRKLFSLMPLCKGFIYLLVIALLLTTTTQFADAKKIQFDRDIRPILSDKCYACHGPDPAVRQANLRLDIKEGAFSEPSGYPIIVPGDPENSELVLRITHEDIDRRMPPQTSNRQPTQEQIDTLIQWIKEGAEWEEHWAYNSPKRVELPEVKSPDWVHNPIDQFILGKLEAEGLEPSSEADKRTLIRRLHFDLTGLLPTPAEVDQFVRDERPEAYEDLVNRLLSKPQYGERLAIYWLDLVRYADTSGYHSDENVSVWPYRDYVIKAFNDNMPFDQFTLENLAGDLLPNASPDQKVASGYNRLNQTTAEGGAQAKEYLAIYAADRVRTTASVWLGATLGCAQCHDHKFDPYTAKDFYSFAAFFADIQGPGVYGGGSKWDPVVMLPSSEQQAKLEEIDDELVRLRKVFELSSPGLQAEQTEWEEETRSFLTSTEDADFAWVDDAQSNGGRTEGAWKFVGKNEGPVFSKERSRVQTAAPEQLVQHAFRGANRKLTLAEGDKLFAYVWLDPENPPKTIMLQWNDGNWEHRAFWGEDKIKHGEIGSDTPGHKPMGELPHLGEWVRLEVEPAIVGLKAGSVLNGMAFTQFGGKAYWDMAGIATTLGAATKNTHDDVVIKAIQVDSFVRTTNQRKQIADYYRRIAPALDGIRNQIADLERQKNEINSKSPYSLTTVSVQPRTTRILPRGNWLDDSGDIVEPIIPEFLGDLGIKNRRATRLDLAKWVVSKNNPLTARTFVNRLWALYFGTGISRVLDDLGAQGEPPVHSDLLDWLAVEFMESGWNVKHMVKLIVSSNAYRQSSKPNEVLREKDPYNRLIARQSRWRLDAEIVRDNALLLSGLLIPKIGGPSVRPYQPVGYYSNLNFPKRRYVHDKGESQYRRGLYTHWQRTFLHPSMMAFDAPSRQECTAERSTSNTPMQALTLLNDPTYVEAARVFAARTIKEGGQTPEDRINWAYHRALSRLPQPKELEIMTGLLEKHKIEYTDNPDAAKTLVEMGESPATQGIEPIELAAWTSIARVVLNLHETITRY
ncbi:MAG: PSD1 and planctomycete cytochrome C domain-containing protein [Candidatus Poribacteria bacterium]|nr:PSD1 and planctomycete cytochrome C domain-containing protein [Candidatus Poribacteria bacterium]